MVDTVLRIFVVLDGVGRLGGQEGDLILKMESDHEKLNEDLQEMFLGIVE